MPEIHVLVQARDMSQVIRRVVDIGIVVFVAPLVVLLVLALALVVKVSSPGPAFVLLERFGRGGRPFKLVKLRTMVANAAELQRELVHRNALQWPDFKIPHDPRVTRVGRWLRKFSLDELPQVWNVLRGDMTLVGPRPSAIPISSYRLWQTERLEATPGLFGYWQAKGRGMVDFDTRCRMDISQVRTRSCLRTLGYVVMTGWAALTSRGAY